MQFIQLLTLPHYLCENFTERAEAILSSGGRAMERNRQDVLCTPFDDGEEQLDPFSDMAPLLELLKAKDVRLIRPQFILRWFQWHGENAETVKKKASKILSTRASALPWKVTEQEVRKMFHDFAIVGNEINELSGLIDVEEIIELLFTAEHVDAYRRIPRWLLEAELRKHGCTPLPHRRDLERKRETALGRAELRELGEEVFLDVNSLSDEEARKLQIITVSWCWLHPEHPDPYLYHLATLDKLIKCFMKGSIKRAKSKSYLGKSKEYFRDKDYCMGAKDKDGPIGIFIDWCSIYQDHPANSRTPGQLKSYQNAMKDMWIWFSHRNTIVWMLNYLPIGQPKTPCEPFQDRNGNVVTSLVRADYKHSGWPTLERSLAMMLKSPGNLLDITLALRSRLLWDVEKDHVSEGPEPQYFEKDPETGDLPKDRNGDPILRESKEHKAFVADQINRPLCQAYSKGDYLRLSIDMMCKERSLPLSPEEFDVLLDSKRFSVSSDADALVKPLYGAAFDAIIADASSLNFSELRLKDNTVQPFLNVASVHCMDLRDIDLSGNEITLSLEDFGAAFSQLPHLDKLDLSWNSWLRGNIRSLSSLSNLKILRLYDCLKVNGDVRTLSQLTRLQELNLINTQVSGNIKGLITLLGLKILDLRGCKVSGDIGQLAVLTNLTKLDLPYNQMDGDLQALRAGISGLRGASFPNSLPTIGADPQKEKKVISQSDTVRAAMAIAEAKARQQNGLLSSVSAPLLLQKKECDNSDSDNEQELLPPVEKPLPWPLNEPPGMFMVKDTKYRRPLMNFRFPRCRPGLPEQSGRVDLESLEGSRQQIKLYEDGSSAAALASPHLQGLLSL